ncbi:MAG: phycocyanobilin lyase [Leptolyngbya sp. ERB_1_1]
MTDPRIQPLIQAINQADSPVRLIAAVRTLANERSPDGIPTLIQVLGYNNPGAAVTAMNGLIQLGDVAVPALIEQLDGYDYGARAYSIRALAAIAHPQALDTLIEAAEMDFAPSVRRAATKGIGSLRWDLMPAEQTSEAQAKVLNTLVLVSHDEDWAIRYAAIVGLEAVAIALDSDLVCRVNDRLTEIVQTDSTPANQARAQLAQHRIRAFPRSTASISC